MGMLRSREYADSTSQSIRRLCTSEAMRLLKKAYEHRELSVVGIHALPMKR